MQAVGGEFKSMIRSYWGLWVKNTFFVAFIFFLVNIFLGINLGVNTFSHQVQDKLGIYLYLNDVPGEETEVYQKVITMKNDLETRGITMNFVSKDDALNFLSKKIPDLTKNFEKFNIANPLQSTLYITFKDRASYEYIKTIIEKNKSIIDNYKDIEKGTSLHTQENRVVGIMNLSWFIRLVVYVLGILLLVLAYFLLKYFLKSLSYHFHQDMYRKKLMGAKKIQIMKPLLQYSLSSMGIGLLIAVGLVMVLGIAINYYISSHFGVNSFSYIFSREFLFMIIGELIIVLLVSFIVSYSYLSTINKKLR